MTTELIAFPDESRKPTRNPATGRVDSRGLRHYVVAAAAVINGDIPNIRRQLRQVEDRLGYPLHYRNLSTTRRMQTLEADHIDGWDGYLHETARALPDPSPSEHHVRAKTVTEAFTYLSSERAEDTPNWHGISADTASRGLKGLIGHGLLDIRKHHKTAPPSPLRYTADHLYTLQQPFEPKGQTQKRRQ